MKSSTSTKATKAAGKSSRPSQSAGRQTDTLTFARGISEERVTQRISALEADGWTVTRIDERNYKMVRSAAVEA
jgi:hypothetical protein